MRELIAASLVLLCAGCPTQQPIAAVTHDAGSAVVVVPAAVAPAPPPQPTAPAPAPVLEWLTALYPKAKVERALIGASRDDLPGKIREAKALRQPIAGGYVVAFLLELRAEPDAETQRLDGDRAGKYLQVLYMDSNGKLIAVAKGDEPFPIGRTWEPSRDEGNEDDRTLDLLSLEPIAGTDRAVLLGMKQDKMHSSTQYRVLALDGTNALVSSNDIGFGEFGSYDLAIHTSTYTNIRVEDGVVRGTLHETWTQGNTVQRPSPPKTSEVVMWKLPK